MGLELLLPASCNSSIRAACLWCLLLVEAGYFNTLWFFYSLGIQLGIDNASLIVTMPSAAVDLTWIRVSPVRWLGHIPSAGG